MIPDPAPGPAPAPRRMYLLVAAGALGVVLLVLPWVRWPTAMPAAAELRPGDPTFTLLTRTCAELDRAWSQGQRAAAERWLSPGFQARQAELLAGAQPRGAGARPPLVGALDGGALLTGRSGGERAVLVFAREAVPVEAGGPAGRSLLALVFLWDGYRFLLDRKEGRALGEGEDARAAAARFAAELLVP
ncbi:MAG: hypothetical protein IT458_03960 [Planctomycetes bacterium]|nr:hypothetical protein [Planctomycetota bacterium]